MAFLSIERSGGIVTLTMSEPATRNAITDNSAVDEFAAVCAEVNANPADKVVIITGAGPAFSSGGNISTMHRGMDPATSCDAMVADYAQGIQRLPLVLTALEVPAIAAVNGPALGAGCDLACMCDIRVASEAATFAESFIHFGIVPGDGGAWLLPRIVGASMAAELSFTGDTLTAAQALEIGLVSRVVAADSLLRETRALAERIASKSGPALRYTKRLLRESPTSSLASLLALSAAYQSILHKTPEHRAAVEAFEVRRRTRSSGGR
ncbi:MAG: crotonase/enoyl-CoA hydratase family protein [Burkholderiaceae bacterium]|nr:crotonase/enoyl-CoA hydratase family protein [Burkholderiaceae bacterium]